MHFLQVFKQKKDREREFEGRVFFCVCLFFVGNKSPFNFNVLSPTLHSSSSHHHVWMVVVVRGWKSRKRRKKRRVSRSTWLVCPGCGWSNSVAVTYMSDFVVVSFYFRLKSFAAVDTCFTFTHTSKHMGFQSHLISFGC